MGKLISELKDNKTDAEIRQAVLGLCSKLPAHLSDEVNNRIHYHSIQEQHSILLNKLKFAAYIFDISVLLYYYIVLSSLSIAGVYFATIL